MQFKSFALLAGVFAPFATMPASALDILLTNDDGFETEYIQELHKALVEAGHRVVMSAPLTGQSGSGGKVNFLKPVLPAQEASEAGLVPAGSPGVGPNPDPKAPSAQFYVNGTPADAMLYGLDVIAPAVFGGSPALVISGPNQGHNVGLLTPHSGTLGAAVTALNRGYPAIAVSAGAVDGTVGEAKLIAQLTLQVVAALDGEQGIKLEQGTGLNVNIPDTDVEPALSLLEDFTFVSTEVGLATYFSLQYFERLGESAIARQRGVPADLPHGGVSVVAPYTPAGHPKDDNEDSESNVLSELVVTVSPIQGTYQASDRARKKVERDLQGLFKPMQVKVVSTRE